MSSWHIIYPEELWSITTQNVLVARHHQDKDFKKDQSATDLQVGYLVDSSKPHKEYMVQYMETWI